MGQKLFEKLKKKVEKELLLFPQLQIFVKVTSRSAKASEIYTYAVYLDQRFFEEKFVSKDWESTVQQCVSYLIRSIRSEFLNQKARIPQDTIHFEVLKERRQADSNCRYKDLQSFALPTWLCRPLFL